MIKETIGNATLYCADCRDVLPILTDLDACVTDPPYGLSFMGKTWDYDVPGVDIWSEVLCALKPGAHLLSFFGSRTYHRGAIPIEDAGFEIRDQLMWLYGSGFPKSYNIAKGIEGKLTHGSANWNDWNKLDGDLVDSKIGYSKLQHNQGYRDKDYSEKKHIENVKFHTKEAQKYEGWGTALKPAHEPIVMARKPFTGSVANNVLEYGTGGINIDECRVGDEVTKTTIKDLSQAHGNKFGKAGIKYPSLGTKENPPGRFPANLMHDGSEVVRDIFPETGKSSGGRSYQNTNQMYSGGWADEKGSKVDPGFGDEGSASRYFYCAKTSKKDRDEGLDALVEAQTTDGNIRSNSETARTFGANSALRKNTHPTVKPTELMRYLCRLVTPKGGVIVDPFMGSGSTGKAAVAEGFGFVGIEMSQEYFDIACARIEQAHKIKAQELF